MRIDIWTHVLSQAYVAQLGAQGQRGPGAFLMAQRALHDIEFRLRVIDAYGDYRQILTPIPAMHVFGAQSASGPTLVEVVRRNNEQIAEIVAGHPDRFAGFVAATPITDPDAATEEAIRSVRDLGALGVQLEEDAINLPFTRIATTRCSPRWRNDARQCGSIPSGRRPRRVRRRMPPRSFCGRCLAGRSTRRSPSRG